MRRWEREASRLAGERTLSRAAASSSASGNPSSWRQIAATTGASDSVSTKSGRIARARCDEQRDGRMLLHRGQRVLDGSRRHGQRRDGELLLPG